MNDTTAGPGRPLDWRWQRSALLTDKRKIRDEPDELVRDTARFRAAISTASSEDGVRRVESEFPALAEAIRLQAENDLCAFELLASILAREPARTIARRLKLAVEIVRVFADLFADPAMLPATSNVASQLAPPGRPASCHAILLLYCYCRGPEAVSGAMDYLIHRDQQHDLTSSSGRRRAAIDLIVRGNQIGCGDHVADVLLRNADLIFTLPTDSEACHIPADFVSAFAGQVLGGLQWGEDCDLAFRETTQSADRVTSPVAKVG